MVVWDQSPYLLRRSEGCSVGALLAPGTRRGLETATSDAYRAEDPEEFEQILHWRLADSPSTIDYYQQLMVGARFDASRNAETIASPALVLHGADDRYVPVANAAALAEALPDARLHIFDGAGHLVFIERAEEVNQEIISFLKPRRPWRKWKPQEPSATPKTVALVESWNRWKPKQLFGRAREATSLPKLWKSRRLQETAEQKTKQLTGRVKDTNEETARKPKETSTLKKLGGWLRRSSQVPGDWAGKLRDWLHR